MIARRILRVLLATSLPGCVANAIPSLPSELEGRAAVLFGDSSSNVRTTVMAPNSIARIEAATDATLFAAALAEDLESLMLPSGPVAPEHASRPMPELFRSYRLDAGSERWRVIEDRELLDAFGARGLPGLDVEACAKLGRCLANAGDAHKRLCEVCEVEAPAPAAPPNFSACRSGWSADPSDPLGACRRPLPDAITCGPGRHADWSGRCAMDSGPCPEGETRTDLPEDARFVPAGTALDPILAEAEPGRVIALGAGDYPPFTITKSVEIVGLCADRTRILGDVESVAVGAAAGTSTLADLRIEGGRGVLVYRAEVHFERVVIRDSLYHGLEVTEGRASARDLVIDGVNEVGIATFSSTVVFEDLAVQNVGAGVTFNKSRSTLRRAALRDSGMTNMVTVLSGRASAEDLLIENASTRSFDCSDATFELTDVAIRGGAESLTALRCVGTVSGFTSQGAGGNVVSVENAALRGRDFFIFGARNLAFFAQSSSLELDRVLVEDNGDDAAVLRDSTLSARDFVARGFTRRYPETILDGISAAVGSTLELERAVVRGADRALVGACPTGCDLDCDVEARLFDVRLEGLEDSGVVGKCLRLVGERVAIAAARDVGLLLDRSSAGLRDLTIDDVEDGVGVELDTSTEFDLERFAVRKVTEGFRLTSGVRSNSGSGPDGHFKMQNGRVSDAHIGVRNLTTSVDSWRLLDRVQYEQVRVPFAFE